MIERRQWELGQAMPVFDRDTADDVDDEVNGGERSGTVPDRGAQGLEVGHIDHARVGTPTTSLDLGPGHIEIVG